MSRLSKATETVTIEARPAGCQAASQALSGGGAGDVISKAFGGVPEVVGGDDRSSDEAGIGAVTDGAFGGGDAGLVVGVAAGQANGGCEDEERARCGGGCPLDLRHTCAALLVSDGVRCRRYATRGDTAP